MDNSDRICLVTGASSGIGRAVAKALLEDGFTVAVTARRSERLEELGVKREDILAGDLNESGFQDALVEQVFGNYGRCDYLFNCAGIIEAGPIEEIDPDRVASMIRLNVEATFRLTYALLKRFREQGSGHVINISSVLGTKVRPGAGAYAASKFAMEALAEALRMELAGTPVQVSCIQPGLVMTELHDAWETHPSKSMGIHEPLSVEDVVETIRFIMKQPAHVRIPKLMILPRDHQI